MGAALNIIDVSDLADERLAEYANLKDPELRRLGAERARGLFIAEGELVVERLVASRFRTRSVLLTPTRLEGARPMLERLAPGTPVYVAPPALMDSIVGFPIHRGIVASAERGPERSMDEVLAGARVAVVLEDLTNHDNIGAMFRNVAALAGGGGRVLLSPRCADPFYRKCIRVSIGNVLHVPFARVGSWPDGLEALGKRGWTVVALTPSRDAIDLGKAVGTLKPPIALVVGTEGRGLTEGAIRASRVAVRIPMASGVDSLNVATAAAIALHRLGEVSTP